MFTSTHARLPIIIFGVALFIVSFRNAHKSGDIKDRITSSSEGSEARMPGIRAIAGYMDTLYVDIPTFRNLAPAKRKLVFKYYITADDSLTLHGWRTKKNNVNNYEYDPTNELILKNGGADTTIPFGPGSYLGGVVLTKDDIDTIRTYISSNSSMSFVMFVPHKDLTYAGHTYYDIFLTDYEPKPRVIHTFTAPVKVGNVGANPSPPRNS